MFLVRLLTRLLLATSLVLLLGSRASGQVDPGSGFPAFGSFNRDAIDTINVGNLNVHFQVPVFAKKGRGLDFFADIVHDNTPYRTSGASPYYFWQVSQYLPWSITSNGGYLFYTGTSATQPCNYNGQNYWPTTYSNFVFVDANRTSHGFPSASVAFPAPCGSPQTTSAQSADGYLLSVTINPTSGAFTTKKVTDPAGNIFDALANTLTDPNGNYISGVAAGTATVTDTTGNTVMTESSTTSSQTYNFPNPTGGVSEPLTLTTSTFTLKTNFRCPHLPDSFNPSSINLTTGISLPDGTSYSIVYESTTGTYPSSNVTGRIHSLTLPSGAAITYTYSGGTNGINCQDGSPAILTKQTPDGTWTYNHYFTPTVNSSGLWTTIVTDPAGNDTVYTFGSIPTTSTPATNTLEDQRLIYQGSHTSGTLLKTVLTCYNGNFTNCASSYNELGNLPLVVTRRDAYTYLAGLSQPSLSETFYDSLGRTTHDNEFGFGVNTGAAPTTTPLQATITSYASIGNNIENRPACVQVTAGASPTTCGTVTSTTNSITNYPTYDSRGNLETIQNWVSGTTYVSRSLTYFSTGLVNTETDFKQTPTTYTYGDCNGSYPTQITRAGLSEYMTWDCNGGAITSTTDPNSQTTNYTYINPSTGIGDPFWRLMRVTYPDTGMTTTTYNDTASPANVITAQLIDNVGHALTTQTNFDGLGRPVQAALTSDPEGTTYTVTMYDALGRPYRTYNPTRCSTPTTNCGESTWGFGSIYYDALGRTTSDTLQDGSVMTTSYSGNCATVTDPAIKKRTACSDSLGRVTQVTEDPGGLGYITAYSYDALTDLTNVVQNGSRQRSFVYDGLSRLTSATNPESGTVNNTYDANSNLLTKVAPAPNQTGSATVTTTYSYDALDRLTQKSYSDGTTPLVSLYYDNASCCPYFSPAIQNTEGRLVYSMVVGQDVNHFSYDPMGRTTYSYQATPSVYGTSSYPVTYTYDLAGDMTSYSGGFGIVFTQTFDAAERPTSVTSNWVDSQHPATLITVNASQGYFPNGAVRLVTLGNGLTETNMLNNRLQPCRINTNSSATTLNTCADSIPSGNLLDHSYGFNSGASNNGNVASWTAVGQQAFNRTYSYDTLNRLATLSDSNTGQQCRGLSWTADAWGNRTSQTTTSGSCYQQPSITFSTKNQLPSPYLYDAAGNMTYDGTHTYTYDAENRLTQVDGGSTAAYVYDGDGHRVRKTTGGVWTDYLYDLAGNSVSEINNSCGSPCGSAFYISLGGRSIAKYYGNTTYFAHLDHLGSTRLMTALNQSVSQNLDYLPFGELNSTDSGIDTHKFTGKERDSESNLDNFGARYYSSNVGRFMSPDPDNTGATLQSPQSWNAYSYVLNNPLNAIDPTGLDCVYTAGAVDNPDSHADGSATVIRGDCKSDQDSGVFVDNAANRPVQSSDVTLSNDGSVGVVSYARTDGITTGYACVGNCPSDTVQVNATPTMSADPYPMSPVARSLITVPFDFWNQTPQQHGNVQACMATGGEYGGETLEPPDVGQAIAQVHEPNGKPAQYPGNNKRIIPNIKGAKRTPSVTGPLGILEFVTDGMNCVQNVANQHP